MNRFVVRITQCRVPQRPWQLAGEKTLPRLRLGDRPDPVADLGQDLPRERAASAAAGGEFLDQSGRGVPVALHDFREARPDLVPVPATPGEIENGAG
jgi:hypothetical protein